VSKPLKLRVQAAEVTFSDKKHTTVLMTDDKAAAHATWASSKSRASASTSTTERRQSISPRNARLLTVFTRRRQNSIIESRLSAPTASSSMPPEPINPRVRVARRRSANKCRCPLRLTRSSHASIDADTRAFRANGASAESKRSPARDSGRTRAAHRL